MSEVKLRAELEVIHWTNREMNLVLTSVFAEGHDRDVAFLAMAKICEKYPELKPTLGYEGE